MRFEILKITVKISATWNALSCTLVDMDLYFKGTVGQDSSVGIATHYKMDGLGLVGGIFSACVQPVLGPTQPPEQVVLVFFARGKAARRGVNHPPLLRNPAKDRVPVHSVRVYKFEKNSFSYCRQKLPERIGIRMRLRVVI